MRSRFQSLLKKHQGCLFEVKRRSQMCKIAGFAIDASDSLVLIHQIDWDSFRLFNYTVIRDEDIKAYRFFDKPKYWQHRAAKKFRLKPVRPVGISIASLPELLESINKRHPLITIHPEKRKPDICYIGPLLSISEQTFTIEDLDSSGEWTGPRRMKWRDVTRVDFGGGYERALAATAPKRPKRK
jgi:hypothetical protein